MSFSNKTFAEAQASHKPMARGGFKQKSREDAHGRSGVSTEARTGLKRSQGLSGRRSGTPQRPRRPMNKVGPRTKEWQAVWRWLKPRLEKAGRISCEFDFLEHECGGPLDPAHSKKRAKMQDVDIYAVAIACRTVHDYLDGVYEYPPLGRRLVQTEMEWLVLKAIDRHGGMVLPSENTR